MKDEKRVFKLLKQRVEAGAALYGCLDIETDLREFKKEALEEIVDALFYVGVLLEKFRRYEGRADILPDQTDDTAIRDLVHAEEDETTLDAVARMVKERDEEKGNSEHEVHWLQEQAKELAKERDVALRRAARLEKLYDPADDHNEPR